MRWAFWVALLFAAAVGLTLFIKLNLSNVVLFCPPCRVEMPPNFVLTALLATFVVLYLVMCLFHRVADMPACVTAYRKRNRILKVLVALREAMESLPVDRFDHAKRQTWEAQVREPQRETAVLIGTCAAHCMQETERRNAWVVEVSSPDREQVELMSMAELLVDAHDAESVLEKITQL